MRVHLMIHLQEKFENFQNIMNDYKINYKMHQQVHMIFYFIFYDSIAIVT